MPGLLHGAVRNCTFGGEVVTPVHCLFWGGDIHSRVEAQLATLWRVLWIVLSVTCDNHARTRRISRNRALPLLSFACIWLRRVGVGCTWSPPMGRLLRSGRQVQIVLLLCGRRRPCGLIGVMQAGSVTVSIDGGEPGRGCVQSAYRHSMGWLSMHRCRQRAQGGHGRWRL